MNWDWQTFLISCIPALVSALIGIFASVVNSIASALIGILVSAINSNKQLKNELTKLKEESVYLIKKDAIFESLEIIDLYLSWLSWKNDDGADVIPLREEVMPLELTKRIRKCYNDLCVTCKDSDLVKLFLDIIFCEDGRPLPIYKEYRNKARRELGLKPIDIDKIERIFISTISTDDLDQKSTKITALNQ